MESATRAAARLKVGRLPVHEHCANGDCHVHIAGITEVAHASGVEAAPGRFLLVNNLHGADFWGAGNGAVREAGAENIEHVFVGTQFSGHVGDNVHDVGVLFNHHQIIDLNRAVLADAAHVIAGEVNQHDMFGAFLFVRQQFPR